MESTKTKTLFTRQNKIILTVLGIVLMSAIAFLATMPKPGQADPLKELLRSAKVETPRPIENNQMKADFITNSPLVHYSGPISASLQSCINSTYDPYTDPLVQIFFDGESANVIEYYNPNFRDTYTGTVSDIKNELNPVFGQAIRTNSINWLWNGSNLQYNFIVPRGDEKLWTCYFKNETNFFKSFFGYVTPVTAYAVPNMGNIPLNVFFTSEVHFGRAPYTYTWKLKSSSYTGEIIIPLGSTQTYYSGSVRYTIRDRGAYTAELKVRSSDNIEKYGYTWLTAGSQPVMPTNVTAWSGYFSDNTVMEIALSWDNVEPTGWYDVYRVQCSDSTCSSTLNGKDLGKFLATGGNRKTIVDNNGLQPNSWYIYYIHSNIRGWPSHDASMIVSTGNTAPGNSNTNSSCSLGNGATYSDVNKCYWAYAYIEDGVAKGFFDAGTNFYPEQNINRAELAQLIYKVAKYSNILTGIDTVGAPQFTDVPSDAWYYPYVATVTKANLMSGYKDANGNPTGYFGPGDMVTRALGVKSFINAAGVPNKTTPAAPFTDLVAGSWYMDYISTAYNWSIVDGKPDGTFGPNDMITRAELASILSRSLNPSPRAGTSSCTDTSWTPNPIDTCSDRTVTQTSNCGNTRTIDGQKICPHTGGGSSGGGSTSSGSTIPSGSGSSL